MGVLACVGMLAAGCGGGDDDTAFDRRPRAVAGKRAHDQRRTSRCDDCRRRDDPAAADRGPDRRDRGARWPDWLAVDEHGVWAKDGNGSVVLIDPATNVIVATVDVDVGGELCQGLGAGDGSIWACSGPDVARIDASHPEVLSVIPVGKTDTQGNLGVSDGQVWILIGDGSRLHGYLTDTQDLWSTVPAAGARHGSRCWRGRDCG